jgi:phosphonoacetaldehyde hydrolase
VDFGSLAPARTLQRLFSRLDISLTEQETRHGMGLPKKEHIRGILSLPAVRDAWQQLHGHIPTDAHVNDIYAEFIPLQFSCLEEYSSVIPGVAEIVNGFRKRGLKIGSTTGYTRAMLDLVMKKSASEGYIPDCSLTPEEVGAGRPHPFMMYECAVRLQVSPLSAIAKVGDTPADVHEGLNAGAWSIGVAGTGNAVGLSLDEFQALPAAEKESRLTKARTELKDAGAHYVVDALDEIHAVLDDIDSRLSAASTSSSRADE